MANIWWNILHISPHQVKQPTAETSMYKYNYNKFSGVDGLINDNWVEKTFQVEKTNFKTTFFTKVLRQTQTLKLILTLKFKIN